MRNVFKSRVTGVALASVAIMTLGLMGGTAASADVEDSASTLQAEPGELSTAELLVLSESQSPEEAQEISASASAGNEVQVLWNSEGEIVAAHPYTPSTPDFTTLDSCFGVNVSFTYHNIGGREATHCYDGKGTWNVSLGGFVRVRSTTYSTGVSYDDGVASWTGSCPIYNTCNIIPAPSTLTQVRK